MENYKTIKELADDLHVSKQAVWQKIKRNKSTDLRKFMTTKGNTVYVDVCGQKLIIEMFSRSFKEKSINSDDRKVDDAVNVDGNRDLNEELQFLRKLVDKLQTEKSELHKIVDQQQQLTLQSNKQIEQLQNQLRLMIPPNNEIEIKQDKVVEEYDLEKEVQELFSESVKKGPVKSVMNDVPKKTISFDAIKKRKKWWEFWK